MPISSWFDQFVEGGSCTPSDSYACPYQTPEDSEQYIQDIILHQFLAEGNNLNYNHVSPRWDREIEFISELNERKRRPPRGRAGTALSRLVLLITNELGLYLSPETTARHEARSIYSGQL